MTDSLSAVLLLGHIWQIEQSDRKLIIWPVLIGNAG